MSPYIPALNEIPRQAFDDDPEYHENHEERRYMILFPEDHDGHGVDMEDNVALLLDREQAAEIRRLADEIVRDLGGDAHRLANAEPSEQPADAPFEGDGDE
jgi:hypothetical protein